MAKGGGWGAGKIVLVIVGVLALLGAGCCGLVWLAAPAGMVDFVASTAKFAMNVESRLGKGYVGAIQPDDQDGELVVVLAVPSTEELTPERVRELQDIGWEIYVSAFADGGLPVKRLGIGTVKKGSMGGAFVGWRDNQVPVGELVERTGLAAPPESKFAEAIREKAAEEDE